MQNELPVIVFPSRRPRFDPDAVDPERLGKG